MLNNESKTLRTFTSTIQHKGKAIKLRYGYDATTSIHSGFFIEADIDGKGYKTHKKAIKKVLSFKNETLTELLEYIDTDISGSTIGFNYDDAVSSLVDGSHTLLSTFRTTTDEEITELNSVVEFCNSSASTIKRKNAAKKYINARLVTLIEKSYRLVRSIQKLTKTGIDVGTESFSVTTPCNKITSYQKRDVDYIRKARVRLFETVLNRKYQPMSR